MSAYTRGHMGTQAGVQPQAMLQLEPCPGLGPGLRGVQAPQLLVQGAAQPCPDPVFQAWPSSVPMTAGSAALLGSTNVMAHTTSWLAWCAQGSSLPGRPLLGLSCPRPTSILPWSLLQ